MRNHHPSLLIRRALLVAVACLLLLPAVASAVDVAKTTLTVDQTTAGQPTRFTFSTVTGPDEKVTAIEFAFPKGTDLGQATADAVTLEGLNRHDVKSTLTKKGETLDIALDPAVAPKSTLRIRVHGVVTPRQGGTMQVGGTYQTESGSRPLPALDFEQTRQTWSDRAVNWLDQQAWVEKWNSVGFLNGFFNPQLIVQSIPLLFKGWLLAIGLIAVAYPAAIPLGLMVAFAKMSKIPPLRWIASAYINVIRGTPLFLQIYIAFFGLPLIGLQLPDIPLGMGVLAFNSAAYMAEIFRAGIQSINKGQFEAASSLGMTYPQSMAYVIIPQTVRRVLPTMTSEFILLFKDTALLSAVGIFELMMNAKNSAANAGNVTAYTVAAVYYLIVTIPLINWVGNLEAKLALSEGGQGATKERKHNWFGLRRQAAVQLEPEAAVSQPDTRDWR